MGSRCEYLLSTSYCSVTLTLCKWEGNLARIIESIHQAKAAGARLRVGPVSRAA
jgi:NAD+ synthase (glutamine-hydrolysing)